MSAQTIIVCLNDIDRTDQMLNVVKAMSGKMNCHFVGLYVIPAVQIYSGAGIHAAAQVYDGMQKYFRGHAGEVKAKFNKLLSAEGLNGEWRQVKSNETEIAREVIKHGMISDLVVIPQAQREDDDKLGDGFAEQVVMECGRPALIIPSYGEFDDFGKSILVAWNGKREAARAIFDAQSIMASADKVNVSWLDPDKTEDNMDLPGAELAVVLARHGINVVVEAIPTGGLAVGEALLSHAADTGADMLVMGAYGHSRLREFIFGGATRTILQSMTVPVLMSH